MATSYEPNNKIFALYDKAFERGLTAVGLFVQNEAVKNIKQNENIDTGRLINSITFATKNTSAAAKSPAKSSDGLNKIPQKDRVEIGSNVEYAAFVEYRIGTKAKPYLRPAVDMNISRIKAILGGEIKKELA